MERTAAEAAEMALTEMQAQRTATKPTSEELSQDSQKIEQLKTAWERKWLKLQLWNPGTRRMADSVQRFCGGWFRNRSADRMLVLAGRSGCGKTHAMKGAHRFSTQACFVAAEKGLWDWPASLHWNHWPETARKIVEAGKNVHMADELYESIESDVLFLDDIGAESDKFRSGETVDALCQLLSRRERKWTMVTTNYLPEEWPDRFDARVADRLLRGSVICDLRDSESFSTRAA